MTSCSLDKSYANFYDDEPEINVVGEGTTASETIDLVRATRPQLLFLDIQMPGMDGFDIATELCSSKTVTMPHIIFTTAHDQYALRAFEIHAVDYLLKPFTRERLSSAVERVRKEILLASQQPANAEGQNGRHYTTRIVFKSRGRIVFLPVSDIRWISAEENYVRICTQRRNSSTARDHGPPGRETRPGDVFTRSPFFHRQPAARKRGAYRN